MVLNGAFPQMFTSFLMHQTKHKRVLLLMALSQQCHINDSETALIECIPTSTVEWTTKEQPFYSPLIQDNPVLSQRRDLLEQSLDFYEPDVLPATQPVVSKHYRKPRGLDVFCFTDMACLTNSVKALKKYTNTGKCQKCFWKKWKNVHVSMYLRPESRMWLSKKMF